MIAQVGVMDLLRYPLFNIGARTLAPLKSACFSSRYAAHIKLIYHGARARYPRCRDAASCLACTAGTEREPPRQATRG